MNSRWAAVLLPFLAGVAIVFAVAGVYLLVSDSGGGNDAVSGSRTPTPTSGPYPVLAEGEYIDSLPTVITLPSGLDAVPITVSPSVTNSIAVVEFTELVETIVPTLGPGTPTPANDRFRPIPWTTYKATVQEWIKGGNGVSEITMTVIGGVEGDEPRLLTGTFLPQLGRKYLMILDPDTPDAPGIADYVGALAGWGSFEIGDGLIHVLNENNSRRLMGAYNLTPVDDFIAMVREWIIAPPAVTPTPPPSPTASA